MKMTHNEPGDGANPFLDTGQVLELFTQVRKHARDAEGLLNATETLE